MKPQSTSFPALNDTILSVKLCPLSWLLARLVRPSVHPSHLTSSPQIAGGIIGTLSIIVYGQLLRRPPIPINRIASLSAVASAGGVIGGTAVRANAHADFFRNLDSQSAFYQAIDNIHSRLGEKPSDQHTTPAYPYPSSDNENQEMADSAVSSRRSWEESSVNRAAVGPKSSIVTHPTHLAEHLSFVFLRRCTAFPKQESLGGDPSGTCA